MLHYLTESYPLWDDDKFYNREAEHTHEAIVEILKDIAEDVDEGRGLLPGHPPIDSLAYDVERVLNDNEWDTYNIDDFVLDVGQVLTALRELKMIDEAQFDELEFCPIDYRGWSKWSSDRYDRRSIRPKAVWHDIAEYVNNPHPTFYWELEGGWRAPEKVEYYEFEYVVGPRLTTWNGVPAARVQLTTTEYTLPDPLPLADASPDVWVSWRVRVKLRANGYSDWAQGWTYNMQQVAVESA